MTSPITIYDESGNQRLRGTQRPPGGGSQAVNVARAYLANADILALPTSPIELVAAPGAGQMLVPSSALIYCDTAAGGYGNISDGGELGPCLTVPGDVLNYLWEASVNARVSTLLSAGAVVVAPFGPQSYYESVFATQLTFPFVFTSDELVDAPLILRASNDADYEDGDPANFMVVTVTYSILDLTAP